MELPEITANASFKSTMSHSIEHNQIEQFTKKYESNRNVRKHPHIEKILKKDANEIAHHEHIVYYDYTNMNNISKYLRHHKRNNKTVKRLKRRFNGLYKNRSKIVNDNDKILHSGYHLAKRYGYGYKRHKISKATLNHNRKLRRKVYNLASQKKMRNFVNQVKYNMGHRSFNSIKANNNNIYLKGRNDANSLLFINPEETDVNGDEQKEIATRGAFLNNPSYIKGFINGAKKSGVSMRHAQNILSSYRQANNNNNYVFHKGWNNGLYDNDDFELATSKYANSPEFQHGWYLGDLIDRGGNIKLSNHDWRIFEVYGGHFIKYAENKFGNNNIPNE